MKKRLGMAFAIVFATAVSVCAQTDIKAKEILDQVSAKTKTFTSMSAEFVFSMVNKEMDINEQNNGTIKVKGQKYKVSLPGAGLEIYSNGETIWNYMKEGNQVTITNVEDAGSELMDPSSIFSIYERGFRSKFIAEKKEGSKTLYQIELYPDSEEFQVDKIDVNIDKATMFLDSATLYGTDENLYGIVVNKMETNKSYADSDFVFDKSKHVDVEVIDLR
ncbi:outer membrane lipoprotein carrier protein LolA [Maribellus sp. YY47]|uniref:LolA family protein n=1 Tax=Maribellus sp. YY47 TaxID=2929486 RepID=UPI002000EFC0|nr:outer membrane lipoprotein carrier protein LolA [Maribellus sp. YY47]MCK3685290.1 outer membrane lipoprotein carrier protein LolA [Maribellus sp. YY47]